MPINCDPNSKHRVVLITDKKKDPAVQPAFFFRVLNIPGRAELLARNAAGDKLNTDKAAIDHEIETIKMYLLGWENITDREGKEIPYDPEKIEDILAWYEAVELNQALVLARPDFLKGSGSASPSQ